MRFLLDMPVSPQLTKFLAEQGHDAVHARDIGMSRASDAAIAQRARDEDRVVVTADLDFPQLLALSGASSPGVILFRGGAYSECEMRRLLACVLTSDRFSDVSRAITVVERDRMRVTKLPIQRSE